MPISLKLALAFRQGNMAPSSCRLLEQRARQQTRLHSTGHTMAVSPTCWQGAVVLSTVKGWSMMPWQCASGKSDCKLVVNC